MTDHIESNRAPLLFHIQLFCIISKPKPSVNSNWSYFLKMLNSGPNRCFFARVTLKIDRWPWKTIGHLLHVTSSFVLYFIAISGFKRVTVRNPPIRVKIDDFFGHVTLILEIWRMTLKNNRTPLLCHIKLSASFHHHMWIQTGIMVRKRLILDFDLCNLDLWPLTLTLCMDITSVIGKNHWKFHDDTMMGT